MPIRKPKPTSPGAASPPTPTSPRSRRPSPRSRSSRASRSPAGATPTAARPSRHRGGGAKRLYRKIDFKRRKDGIPAKVAAIEYDPNRTAYIALLHYADGEKRYILAPARLQVGVTVRVRARRGDLGRQRLPLANIPVGTVVHNVELQPGRGGQLGALRRRRDPAHGEGGRHGDAAPALRRDAHGPRGVPRDGRRRSATPTTRTSRSARPAASATWACARRRAAPP